MMSRFVVGVAVMIACIFALVGFGVLVRIFIG